MANLVLLCTMAVLLVVGVSAQPNPCEESFLATLQNAQGGRGQGCRDIGSNCLPYDYTVNVGKRGGNRGRVPCCSGCCIDTGLGGGEYNDYKCAETWECCRLKD